MWFFFILLLESPPPRRLCSFYHFYNTNYSLSLLSLLLFGCATEQASQYIRPSSWDPLTVDTVQPADLVLIVHRRLYVWTQLTARNLPICRLTDDYQPFPARVGTGKGLTVWLRYVGSVSGAPRASNIPYVKCESNLSPFPVRPTHPLLLFLVTLCCAIIVALTVSFPTFAAPFLRLRRLYI